MESNDSINGAVDDAGFKIEQMRDGEYRHTFSLPGVFHGSIIGQRGNTKRNLQADTGTRIFIPPRNSQEIVIMGETRDDVISCRQQIDLIVANSRRRMAFTHFVSIPLTSEAICSNYEEFKREVLRDSEAANCRIVEEIFVNPKKLHLTVGMLLLLDEEEKKKAVDVFHSCIEEVVIPILKRQDEPISIEIRGLECMNRDLTKVKVVYGKVCPNDVLQEIADKIFQYFLQRGLMRVEFSERVNLHMTVMKTSKLLTDRSQWKARNNNFINAEKLMKDFGGYNFGKIGFDTIRICDMSSTEPNEGYKVVTEVKLDRADHTESS